MREMRHISQLFSQSTDFDEQWILFKAYLNTIHSLSDNDADAKRNFIKNELMDFSLVLRSVVHHQPAKWHYGKHDVQPTSLTFNFSQDKGAKMTGSLSLVIQKDTLENPELQETLGNNSEKQLSVLNKSLTMIQGHVIVVSSLIGQIQQYVEQYCKDHGKYTKAYDNEPLGYTLVKNV